MIGSLQGPPDNLLQQWHNECYDKYKSIATTPEQLNWMVETCKKIAIRIWMNENEPSVPLPPSSSGESSGEYLKKLEVEEKKTSSKRLWMFAGVSIGLFVLVTTVVFIKDRRRRR